MTILMRCCLFALLALLPCFALAQTGTVPLLCENPNDPTDKRAFSINYDRRVVIPSHTMMDFTDSYIQWTDAPPHKNGGRWYNRFFLDRRTAVLVWFCCGEPTDASGKYNCQKAQGRNAL